MEEHWPMSISKGLRFVSGGIQSMCVGHPIALKQVLLKVPRCKSLPKSLCIPLAFSHTMRLWMDWLSPTSVQISAMPIEDEHNVECLDQ